MPGDKKGGYFLIHKPAGWTSFQVVKKIKKVLLGIFNEEKKLKVGHAGTLDPLAEGLMIICYGTYTKKIAAFQREQKTYEGIFYLGATTPSYDPELPVNQTFPTEHITDTLIQETAKKFCGTIFQKPPEHSAVKIGGVRSYQLAREGRSAELKEKPVEIFSFDITFCSLPEVGFRVRCSKGTYIRALARDFGIALKSGAYLKYLCRTHIGAFSINEAWDIRDCEKKITEYFSRFPEN